MVSVLLSYALSLLGVSVLATGLLFVSFFLLLFFVLLLVLRCCCFSCGWSVGCLNGDTVQKGGNIQSDTMAELSWVHMICGKISIFGV